MACVYLLVLGPYDYNALVGFLQVYTCLVLGIYVSAVVLLGIYYRFSFDNVYHMTLEPLSHDPPPHAIYLTILITS